MRTQLLISFALGVAVSTAAFLIIWVIKQVQEPRPTLTLVDEKPTGVLIRPDAYYAADPGRKFEDSLLYLAAIASQCRIAKWDVERVNSRYPEDNTGELTVGLKGLGDEQFKCLARFVKAPYVQMIMKSGH